MEFQQKGQQITLAGRYFMKTDGEANYNGKKIPLELTFMVKAFTQNVGSYWLMNFHCRKNVVFIFLYGPRPKLHLW
jgi:hypothetical protein